MQQCQSKFNLSFGKKPMRGGIISAGMGFFPPVPHVGTRKERVFFFVYKNVHFARSVFLFSSTVNPGGWVTDTHAFGWWWASRLQPFLLILGLTSPSCLLCCPTARCDLF